MSSKSIPQTNGDVTLEQSKEQFRHGAFGRRQSSIDEYCHCIQTFIEWARAEGIRTVEDITPVVVRRWRKWVESDSGFASPTISHKVNGVRQWLGWLEDVGDIPEGCKKMAKTYTVPQTERRWNKQIEIERVDAIVSFMEREYPHHRDTLIMKTLAQTGMRMAGLHSIDVGDVRLDDMGRPEIRLRDRPDSGTRLKRGRDKAHNHERNVPITRELFDDLKAYARHHRHEVEDDYGRLPLFTTRNGRMSKSQIRDTCYKWTCPCHIGDTESCSCDSKPTCNQASKCDMSVSPHALRGSAVTRFRNAGKTWDDIADLVGAKPDILQLHYDRGSIEDKADRARSLLDAL